MNNINSKISYKIVFAAALAVLVILLIPMLAVSRYMVMTGDDYSFSTCTHQALQSGSSVIAAAAEKTAEVYNSWQGSFAAVFLMTLQPGIFGYQYYGLTTVIMLLALCGGLFYFCKTLFSDIFGTDRYGAAFVAAVISIFATQFLPLAYQSFYWYNGSVYYTFFFGLELITAGLCLSYIHDGKIWKAIIAGIFAFVIGGGNYVTALLGAILLLIAVIMLIIKKDRKYIGMAVILLVLLVALIISATAPGNMVRQAENPDHPGAVMAVWESLKYGVQYILRWLNLPTVAMIILIGPIMWDMAGKSKNGFSMPGLFSLISYLLFSSMFCPHVYAMGSPGPERILNIIYFAFLILVALNIFWWMGWIHRKVKTNSKCSMIVSQIIAGVISCILIVFAVKMPGDPATMTSAIALSELRSGEALSYYEENLLRFEILENTEEDGDAVLRPLNYTPILLFSEDMKVDPDNYMNKDAATYFGIKSIIVDE